MPRPRYKRGRDLRLPSLPLLDWSPVPRPTPVRDAIRELVSNGSRHTWSLEQMLDAVRAGGQTADPSSVFRAALALEQDGTLEKVELGDGRSHYEARTAHHD